MNRISRLTIGITLYLLFSGSKYTSPLTEPLQRLDSLFDFYQEHELYFVSAKLEKAGETIFERAAGYQNVKDGKELDSNSVFMIGSITKTYTATMIMQLVEEGRLRLSDKLSEFYPQVPNAGKIDIEMLLRHRSGLFNYTAHESFLSYVARPIPKQRLLQQFSILDTMFSPGARYQYSNTNYVLLGFILEDITADSYGNQLQQRILNKLNLKNTYYGRPGDRSHFAYSYNYQSGGWLAARPEWNTDWALAAGAISATVNDVSSFYKGLFAGKLVSKESLRQMMELQDGYGLGLAGIPYGDRIFYGHSGGIESYRSSCGYHPGDSILFTYVSTAARQQDPNEVAIQVLNAAYGNTVSFPDTAGKQVVKLTPATLSGYEGTYEAPGFPLEIRIFVKDGQLQGQATGQSAFPLSPHSESRFSFSPAAISMEFFTEDGIQKFHFEQGPTKLDFTRKLKKPH